MLCVLRHFDLLTPFHFAIVQKPVMYLERGFWHVLEMSALTRVPRVSLK